MKKTTIIKNLPHHEGLVGWNALSPFQDQLGLGQLKGTHSCDFAIIGAGYSGLSLAHRLAQLQPNAKIILLDAMEIADSTAGRNAGFIIDVPHNLNPRTPNLDEDLMQLKLNQFAISKLEAFNEAHKIDTSWQKIGKYLAAHEEKHFDHLDYFKGSLDLIKAPYQILNQNELQARLGTQYYQKAVYTPNAILMNPAALTHGIASILPESVQLYTRSPITRIDNDCGKIVLHAQHGQINAAKLILATNAFTEGFGVLSNKLIPVFTYASLTRPLTATERALIGNPTSWGVTAAHGAGSTVRYTSDHRLFMRNQFDFIPALRTSDQNIEKAKKQHIRSLQNRFPQLNDIFPSAIEFSWGGMICVTRNQQPFFGQLSENTYAFVGMNGVGVAKGTYLGHYMGDYLSGIESPELNFILKQSPTWVPPDPFRYLGVKLRFMYEENRAGGEI